MLNKFFSLLYSPVQLLAIYGPVSHCPPHRIFLLVLLIVLTAHTKTQANIFSIEAADQIFQLQDHTFILNDSSQNLNWDQVVALDREAENFLLLSEWDRPFYGRREYWAKIILENQLPKDQSYTDWVLNLPLANTKSDVFVVINGTLVQKYNSGIFVPYPQRSFAPKLKANTVRLTLLPGQSVVLYIKNFSDRGKILPEFDFELQSSESFFNQLNKEKHRNALFIGFVLMMLVYNLILYLLARDLTYIYYGLYLIAITAYTSYAIGEFADWVVPSLIPLMPQWVFMGKLIAYLALLAYMQFIRSFLDLDKLLPVWDRIFTVFMWIGLPTMVLDALLMAFSDFDSNISDVATIAYILVFLLLSFIFLYFLYKTKDVKGLFIIVGVLFMGIGLLITVFARFQSVNFSVSAFKAGAILEIIVFSLGLAYRQRENERQSQLAQFELEKSKLIFKQEQEEKERLKELNQFKNRLYTNITHEFRTPLTVIAGMAEEIKDNEEQREMIFRNSQQLLHLVNQILDLSKLEAHKLELKPIQINVISFLQYLTESFFSAAKSKNIGLSFYPESDMVLMDVDENLLQQVIYNLLSNAIKFTPYMGSIILHVKKIEQEEKPYLQIVVKDTGLGITAKDLPHIFDRFYQADNMVTGMGQGTGIGLSLTKELVKLMGGSIQVLSKVDKGSTFTILLPITNQAELEYLTRSEFEQNKSLIAPQIEASNEALWEEGEFEKPLLLIVEDNSDVQHYLGSILSRDYRIATAEDGRKGLIKAFELVPDIILSDVMMPYMDGLELCKTLKRDRRTSHIPVVLLTAKASTSDRLEGLEQGADAYLMKPFNKQELFLRLEKLIELRKVFHQRYGNLDLSRSKEEKQKNLEEEFLRGLIEYIETRIDDIELSIPDLCKASQMSHTQLYRKLKALTQQTPSRFVRLIRLRKAKELLIHTEMNVSEVAYQVGFKDPNYFSRTFHDEFGLAPSAIRGEPS